MIKRFFFALFLFALVISLIFFSFNASALDGSSASESSSEAESSEYEITYSPQFSFDFEDNSLPEIFSWDPDEFEEIIDVPGALESLDPDVFDAAGGFKALFTSVSSAFKLTPVLILLLVIGIGLMLIGR